MENTELLQAIYARYIRGVGGEKEVAERILRKKLEVLGLSLEDYEERFWEGRVDYFILKLPKAPKEMRRVIFCYAMSHICTTEDEFWGTVSFWGTKEVELRTTEINFLEVQNIVTILWRAFQKEQRKQNKALIIAFSEANDLHWEFKSNKEEEEPKRKGKALTEEEIEAILLMAQGIKKTEIRKPLEHK